MSLTSPYEVVCSWCGEVNPLAESYVVLRKFINELYDPENPYEPTIDQKTETLCFCNHNHRNQFLYGV